MDNKVINSLPIFKSFKPNQIKKIKPLMEFCSFPADMVIFQQGDRAENFYILTSGEIALHFKPYDGPSLVITKISSGKVFGWSAALNRPTYNAAAVTINKITAIRMKASKLKTLCATDPDTASLFLNSLVEVISDNLNVSHQEILNLLSQGMNLNGDCGRRMDSDGNENRIYA